MQAYAYYMFFRQPGLPIPAGVPIMNDRHCEHK